MSNPFETGLQKVIPAVLIYAFSLNPETREREVLLVYQTKKGIDGKWNGLGGKLEVGESFLESCRREFLEEAGIEVEQGRFKNLGFLHFPNFKKEKGEDWICPVYVVELDADEREVSGDEGELRWVPLKETSGLNFWDGDKHFLPYVFKQDRFNGTLWYENGSCVRVEFEGV